MSSNSEKCTIEGIITLACSVCGNVDHRAETCPERCVVVGCIGYHMTSKHPCFVCVKFGVTHLSKDCPKNLECEVCGELGHIWRDCPDADEEYDECEVECEVCGEFGHIWKDCQYSDRAYNLARRTSHLQTLTYLKAEFGSMGESPVATPETVV